MYTLSLLLLILGTVTIAVMLSSTIFLLKNSQVAGQIGGESETKIKKQDIFKIILTVNGLTMDSGDVICDCKRSVKGKVI